MVELSFILNGFLFGSMINELWLDFRLMIFLDIIVIGGMLFKSFCAVLKDKICDCFFVIVGILCRGFFFGLLGGSQVLSAYILESLDE